MNRKDARASETSETQKSAERRAESVGDAVFKALADPVRRLLLDKLFEREGQTLVDLCGHVPEMTRFGVMKHLRVLEEAELVVTRRAGREKLHYLNPVPIRLIHDRWISKYAAPLAAGLSRLKTALESEAEGEPRQVFEVSIRSTPVRVWRAITDPAFTRRYFLGLSVSSDWRPGTPFTYRDAQGRIAVEGEILEATQPRRLVTTWSACWDEQVALDRPSRVSWEIVWDGSLSRLRLVHDDFASETETYRAVGVRWPVVLSRLKSLLETGQ